MLTFSKDSQLGDAHRILDAGIEADNISMITAGLGLYKSALTDLGAIGGESLHSLVRDDFEKRILNLGVVDRHLCKQLSEQSLMRIIRDIGLSAEEAEKFAGLDDHLLIPIAQSVSARPYQHMGSLIDLCGVLAKACKLQAFNIVFDSVLDRASGEYAKTESIGKYYPLRALRFLNDPDGKAKSSGYEQSTLEILSKHQDYLTQTASIQGLLHLSPRCLMQMARIGLKGYPDAGAVFHIREKRNFGFLRELKQAGYQLTPSVLTRTMFKDEGMCGDASDFIFRDSSMDAQTLETILPADTKIEPDVLKGMISSILKQLNFGPCSRRVHLPEKLRVATAWLMNQPIDLPIVTKKILSTEHIPHEIRELILANPACREHSLYVDLGL